MVQKKLVIVGDSYAQKTTLLHAFLELDFPKALSLRPTVLAENYAKEVAVVDQSGKKRVVELSLWDTAGLPDYDRLRPLSYPDTDVILVCFSVKEPDSFENIQSKWIPEIQRFCPGVPFFIIGHKTSLADDANSLRERVTREQGRRLARKVGAVAYMECCARTGKCVNKVFVTAALASLKKEKKRHEAKSSEYFIIVHIYEPKASALSARDCYYIARVH